MELSYFQKTPYYEALQNFFAVLNLPLNPITEAPASPAEILSNTFNDKNQAHRLIDDIYVVGMVSDEAFSGQQKKRYQDVQHDYKTKDYEGLLLFGVTLKNGDRRPTRGQLAEITRTFNREFHYTPVVVIFKYGEFISFANCERMAYKQTWREGEKTGKVSLLKDISFKAPHTGHLKILQALAIERSGRNAITTFADLYKYWLSVFNVSILNKVFYQELSNWYFWALSEVSFPNDTEKNEDIRNAENTIRLITRLIFVWFLKEKGLVPEELFDKTEVDKLLDYQKDKGGSAYYRAILQNLFFATLNVPMNEREFRDEKRFQGKNYDYMNHRVYRYADLFKKANNFEALFGEIPFLNGGLFECLDYRDEKGKEVRIDCYSDNPKNAAKLVVPDRLFFGSDTIDLSEIYDDQRKKAVEVRGIIDILDSYKFTIAENTPVEEEIALEPELLGRVFENLLASYNPETKKTARKQTGSFYTPREVVNYMVDESLKAYLVNTLGDDDETKMKLDQILAYGDGLPDLSPKQSQQIISALECAKILDPACGSGAFPMGILQKMVHVLEKLDPKNKQFKQSLIKRTPVEARQQMEAILAGNTADYIRKLGIIQNCIYGVDIQPIAIQVSKLRFFISLLVDFTVDRSKREDNYGIQPLPNLDYKMMQGNSLIENFHGFTLNLKEQDCEAASGHLFSENSNVIKLVEDLWEKQGEYLRESRPKQKEDLQEEVEKDIVNIFDTYIRQKKAPYFAELKKTLEKALVIPNEKTREDYLKAEKSKLDKRYSFDYVAIERELKDFTHGIKPRNFFPWQLYFADVFRSKGGFDIVIGNPPYISALDFSEIYGSEVRAVLNNLYESARGTYDIFILFMEKGIKLLKEEGVLTYITPNKYLSAKYGTAFREFITTNASILQIADLSAIKVFEEASVYPIISVIENKREQKEQMLVLLPKHRNIDSFASYHYDEMDIPAGLLDLLPEKIWGFMLSRNVGLLPKLVAGAQPLEKFGNINATSTAAEADEYGALISNRSIKGSVKIVNTGTIDKYLSLWGISELTHSGSRFLEPYLPLNSPIINERRRLMYRTPKIIFAKMAKICEALVDLEGEYASVNTNCFYGQNSDIELEYIAAFSNSKLFMFIYNLFFGALRMSGGYYQFQAPQLRVIPLKKISKQEQKPFVRLVQQIVNAKNRNPHADTSALEDQIDNLFYEIYSFEKHEIDTINSAFV